MPLSFGVAKAFRSSEFRDPGVVYGDFFVFNYKFSNGADLDIRASLLTPAGSAGVLGWARDTRITANGQTIGYWGGDNTTGSGKESIYIDKAKFLLAYPSASYIELDLRCFWNAVQGSNVIINMDAYQGGTMIGDGAFGFANPTATNSFPASKSIQRTITLKTSSTATQGERHSRAIINFATETVSYFNP
jgi:hypothetical protein